MPQAKQYESHLRKYLTYPVAYYRRGLFEKLVIFFIIAGLLIYFSFWSIAQWYSSTQSHLPMTYGVTFVPDYAQSLGLNPNQTMQALIGIGVRQFRLTSYWSDIEPAQGSYNFSQLDWEFAQANKVHAKIILVVGLRQPRWPECHPPSWVNTAGPLNSWEPQLLNYMRIVINRYKHNPALEAWQLENEYFLKGFGSCNNFSRSRLITEYQMLKQLDPSHPVIVGRSNNDIGIPVGQPKPDIYGISIYKRVWDANVTHRYLEYPFPGWYYGFLAGLQKIFDHRNMIILELQAEAWPPNGKTITQISLSEQNKSINAARLKNRFSFARSTGMKDAILWGAEYWYYRMEIEHDPSLWNVAKTEFKANDYHNGSYLFGHIASR
jgi:hypothetical protein